MRIMLVILKKWLLSIKENLYIGIEYKYKLLR